MDQLGCHDELSIPSAEGPPDEGDSLRFFYQHMAGPRRDVRTLVTLG